VSDAAGAFEERYARWKRAVQAASLSSDDAAYVDTPEFRALIDLGPEAVPLMVAKMESGDPAAHFLVHALPRLAPGGPGAAELDEARRAKGGPLGDQDEARLWVRWWHARRAGAP
jgi:hypothetical protein